MNIQTIHEHSVDLDLLSGGICIDAGCRGFQFSEAMRDLGLRVVAFDIEDMVAPQGVAFYKMAIMNYTGKTKFVQTNDLQAKYISSEGEVLVDCIDIKEVYEANSNDIDVLKLDIESSELFIFGDKYFNPIPKQISVEWHMHCHRQLHNFFYPACMENLLKWYEPVKHELTQAHGCGLNYWDSLFIRKDLL